MIICDRSNLDKTKFESLGNYIRDRVLSTQEIILILKSIIKVFEFAHENDKIMGSVNLNNFMIEDKDINNIKYVQDRRLLVYKDNLIGYRFADIVSPEIINGNTDNISIKSDIYLIGKILIKLIFNNRIDIDGYKEEAYVSYNTNIFDIELPIGLNEFIGVTTSLNPNERYSDLRDCKSVLYGILEEDEQRMLNINMSKDLTIDCSVKTHVGDTKLKEHLRKGRKIEKANEDSAIILQGSNNKYFFMIADGVSNCSYGSGYDASNTVKKISHVIWSIREKGIKDINDVEKLFKSIVRESNKKIFNDVKDQVSKVSKDIYNNSKGIMATTFSAGVILGSELYYMNLGDSPIYILSNKGTLTLLTSEDNEGNDILSSELSWEKYLNNDSKSSLSKYIGGFKLDDGNVIDDSFDIKVKKINLLDEDTILACTDGLTNYISKDIYSNNPWNKDKEIKKILSNKLSTSNLNNMLINAANNNGGGDNITNILIKIYFK